MILIVLSYIILMAYIMYAVRICGVPVALSDTYYQLKKRGCPAWLFQFTMIASSALMIPIWIEVSTEDVQFLAFLSCSGLMFVGSAPLFKISPERNIHIVGTIVAWLSSLLWVTRMGYWTMPIVLLSAASIYGVYTRKTVFWLEMAAFAWSYICVLSSLIDQ